MFTADIFFPFHNISGYRGESEEAILVGKWSQETQDKLQESIVLGLDFQELYEVFAECSSSGWDGEQARPISKEVIEYAKLFLMSLPSEIEFPEIGAEPDGAITL